VTEHNTLKNMSL